MALIKSPLIKSVNSLIALMVGDAYGENNLYITPGKPYVRVEGMFPDKRPWTDDSAMAQSLLSILVKHGRIDQDALATEFARIFAMDPHRGYGAGAVRILQAINKGQNWKDLSPHLFGPNAGSYGNGAAMRVAPLGPFFGTDYKTIVSEAIASAKVTHWHEDAEAGAAAVALAASVVAYDPDEYWNVIIENTPRGSVLDKILFASKLVTTFEVAARDLGNGGKVSALDTVPFCIWAAAEGLKVHDFIRTMESVANVGGDTDTNCAIVAGIIGNVVFPPLDWVEDTEPHYNCFWDKTMIQTLFSAVLSLSC